MTPDEWNRLMKPVIEEVYPDAPALEEEYSPEPRSGPATGHRNGKANGYNANGGHPAGDAPAREGQQPAPGAGFTYISLADLLKRPEPAYRFVVDDLLPCAGSSLLVAKPKVGKTVLALQSARDVAAGAPFLGRAVQQGTVLYHAFEEKDDEVARTMRRAGVDAEWPIYFHFAELPRDRLAALRAGIMEHRPVLTIIDTLAHWMQVEDFNDYAQVGRAMRPLHALARETGTHIMAVHHAGKTKDGIDSALGSTALTGNVDTILEERESDGERTLETKQRYGTALTRTLLRFDGETGCITMGEGVAQTRARRFEDDVMASIADGHSTESAVRADLHCDKTRSLAALSALVTAGLLLRTGSGHRNSPYMYEVVRAEDDGGL